MQPQVGVIGVGWLVVQRRDDRAHHHRLGVAVLVAAGQRRELVGNLGHRQAHRAGGTVATEFRCREPRIEDRSVGGQSGQPDA